MLSANILFTQVFAIERTYRVHQHSHPFWQLEHIHQGPIDFIAQGSSRKLEGGDVLLVPPGVQHAFGYPASRVAWTSFKFDVEGLHHPECAVPLQPGPAESHMLEAMSLLAKSPHSDQMRFRLNALLSAFLEPFVDTTRLDPQWTRKPDSLLARIDRVIAASEQLPRTVSQLAGQLGYDEAYLSAKFHRETGLRLKAFLDQKQIRRARDFLDYSVLNISEIAEQMNFPEVFSFSRFFKRCTGLTPSDYRKAGPSQE